MKLKVTVVEETSRDHNSIIVTFESDKYKSIIRLHAPLIHMDTR